MKKIEYKGLCIYGIKDLRSDKIIYIGKTVNFKHRMQQHFTPSTAKKHESAKILQEIGKDNLDYELLEIFDNDTVDDTELRKLEDLYILKYDTINNGLNKYRSGLIEKTDIKTYNKIYKSEHKEHYKEWGKKYMKQYYQNNKETINKKRKEYHRQYYLAKKAKQNNTDK